MRIRVVAVGRVRDAGLRAVCDDFLRRASRTLTVDVVEVPEAGRRGGSPAGTRKLEGERLGARIPSGALTVGLTRTGRRLSSAAFADQVGRWRDGARDVALLLGGAYGLDGALLERCQVRLSLSPLTLPHELARLVLLEQLYRSGTILRGEPYHKDSSAPA
ncbi:MAG TPA: 23S rRNA (pseudouridine(1915)-N(3))-methyltransferase RlmH [Gemmatimonadales bacterium]